MAPLPDDPLFLKFFTSAIQPNSLDRELPPGQPADLVERLVALGAELATKEREARDAGQQRSLLRARLMTAVFVVAGLAVQDQAVRDALDEAIARRNLRPRQRHPLALAL